MRAAIEGLKYMLDVPDAEDKVHELLTAFVGMIPASVLEGATLQGALRSLFGLPEQPADDEEAAMPSAELPPIQGWLGDETGMREKSWKIHRLCKDGLETAMREMESLVEKLDREWRIEGGLEYRLKPHPSRAPPTESEQAEMEKLLNGGTPLPAGFVKAEIRKEGTQVGLESVCGGVRGSTRMAQGSSRGTRESARPMKEGSRGTRGSAHASTQASAYATASPGFAPSAFAPVERKRDVTQAGLESIRGGERKVARWTVEGERKRDVSMAGLESLGGRERKVVRMSDL